MIALRYPSLNIDMRRCIIGRGEAPQFVVLFTNPIWSLLRCFRRQSCLDLYEVVSNCIHDQIPDGVKAHFPHEIATVRFDGLGAQVQKNGNFL
jgi:hypothetical protein